MTKLKKKIKIKKLKNQPKISHQAYLKTRSRKDKCFFHNKHFRVTPNGESWSMMYESNTSFAEPLCTSHDTTTLRKATESNMFFSYLMFVRYIIF